MSASRPRSIRTACSGTEKLRGIGAVGLIGVEVFSDELHALGPIDAARRATRLALCPTLRDPDAYCSAVFTAAATRAPSARAPTRSRTAFTTLPIAFPPVTPEAAAFATSSATIRSSASSSSSAGR
jgi:hypothetical protein